MAQKAILFDLDGTLLDTLEDLKNSVNFALKEHGFPERSLDEVRRFIGNGVAALIRRAVPDGTADAQAESCLSSFRPHYLAHMYDTTKPYDGIPALLRELKKHGYSTGVVSNKLEEAVKQLAALHFDGLFDVCIGDVPLRKRKPAPDGVFAAMHALGVPPSSCLYVGDTDVDVLTAHNAGLACVGVTWGFRNRSVLVESQADFIIDKPEELKSLLCDANHRPTTQITVQR